MRKALSFKLTAFATVPMFCAFCCAFFCDEQRYITSRTGAKMAAVYSTDLGIGMLQVVSAMFTELNVQPNTNCSYDRVSVYDGYSDSSPLLGKFCTVAPATLTSSESYLYVVFQTDHSVNTGRFSLSWTFDSIRGRGWFSQTLVDRHLTYCKSLQ